MKRRRGERDSSSDEDEDDLEEEEELELDDESVEDVGEAEEDEEDEGDEVVEDDQVVIGEPKEEEEVRGSRRMSVDSSAAVSELEAGLSMEAAVMLAQTLNTEILRCRTARAAHMELERRKVYRELDKKFPFRGFCLMNTDLKQDSRGQQENPVEFFDSESQLVSGSRRGRRLTGSSRNMEPEQKGNSLAKKQRLGNGFELLERYRCFSCGGDSQVRVLDVPNPQTVPGGIRCPECAKALEQERQNSIAALNMRKKIKARRYVPKKEEIEVLKNTLSPW